MIIPREMLALTFAGQREILLRMRDQALVAPESTSRRKLLIRIADSLHIQQQLERELAACRLDRGN